MAWRGRGAALRRAACPWQGARRDRRRGADGAGPPGGRRTVPQPPGREQGVYAAEGQVRQAGVGAVVALERVLPLQAVGVPGGLPALRAEGLHGARVVEDLRRHAEAGPAGGDDLERLLPARALGEQVGQGQDGEGEEHQDRRLRGDRHHLVAAVDEGGDGCQEAENLVGQALLDAVDVLPEQREELTATVEIKVCYLLLQQGRI